MKRILTAFLLLTLTALTVSCASPAKTVDMVDREGNPITPPARIEKIVTMGPANTEIAVSLGLAEKIVAVDTYSTELEGVKSNIPAFDMMQPDTELIIALEPDIVLVTGMSKFGGSDMYKPLTETGICMAYIPVSNSIEDIKKDILFIGELTGTSDAAKGIVTEFEAQIKQHSRSESESEKQLVYFEIGAAPSMYSFGSGVFLNEMIDLLGAENIFADQDSWISVSDEAVISRNPDVIFTNTEYIDDPVGEIKSRSGWENISAVKNGRVYKISTNPSSLPDQYITIALEEMAKALYD